MAVEVPTDKKSVPYLPDQGETLGIVTTTQVGRSFPFNFHVPTWFQPEIVELET